MAKKLLARFTLWKSLKNDQFYVNLKGLNGEKLLSSEGYQRRAGGRNCIRAALAIVNGKQKGYFKVIQGVDGRWYVGLRTMNHRTILHSQGYKQERFARSRGAWYRSTFKNATLWHMVA